MSDEIQGTPPIDYEKLATAIVAAQEAAKPAVKTAGYVVVDEADNALKRAPFASFGELLMSVKNARLGQVDQRLLPLRSSDPMNESGFSLAGAMGDAFVGSVMAAKSLKAAPSGIGESVPQQGGFLVGSDRSTSILSRV